MSLWKLISVSFDYNYCFENGCYNIRSSSKILKGLRCTACAIWRVELHSFPDERGARQHQVHAREGAVGRVLVVCAVNLCDRQPVAEEERWRRRRWGRRRPRPKLRRKRLQRPRKIRLLVSAAVVSAICGAVCSTRCCDVMCSKIVMCVKFKWLIRFKTLTNRLYHRCNVRIPSICTHLKTGGLSLFACFCGRHKIVLKVKFLLLKFSTISKAFLSFIFTSFLKKSFFIRKLSRLPWKTQLRFVTRTHVLPLWWLFSIYKLLEFWQK